MLSEGPRDISLSLILLCYCLIVKHGTRTLKLHLLLCGREPVTQTFKDYHLKLQGYLLHSAKDDSVYSSGGGLWDNFITHTCVEVKKDLTLACLLFKRDHHG